MPPCIVMQRGESLEMWAWHNNRNMGQSACMQVLPLFYHASYQPLLGVGNQHILAVDDSGPLRANPDGEGPRGGLPTMRGPFMTQTCVWYRVAKRWLWQRFARQSPCAMLLRIQNFTAP